MKIWSERDRLCRVGKTLDMSHVNGESIGMMVFSRAGAEIFVNKIEDLMKQGDGLKRWYLSAIDELAQSGVVGSARFMASAGVKWTIRLTWPTQSRSSRPGRCARSGRQAQIRRPGRSGAISRFQ